VKILVAGLGWAMAELVLTRLVFLWVGARGVEFDWRYIQACVSQPISSIIAINQSTFKQSASQKVQQLIGQPAINQYISLSNMAFILNLK
jgi:hypothetical protein